MQCNIILSKSTDLQVLHYFGSYRIITSSIFKNYGRIFHGQKSLYVDGVGMDCPHPALDQPLKQQLQISQLTAAVCFDCTLILTSYRYKTLRQSMSSIRTQLTSSVKQEAN